mmetsp:Transcript_47743/g.153778  ORF Transcript_47743/g.153778 Transcript_47743/m.153778 type:complete len:277 (+) Transcript_47743:42-872(+)
MVVKIIGAAVRVVETPEFYIDEYAGNVGTKDDQLSIAVVRVAEPTAEPWLTLHYDEWICVVKGRVDCEFEGGSLTAKAGETIFVAKGTRFRPSFPEGGTEYVPVCIPAFRPDRCIREDSDAKESKIAEKLQTLHAPASAVLSEPPPEVLYHMCPVPAWEAAKKSGGAYYPATFEADGHYTHATGVPARLLETANHFYQDDSHAWVCLQMTRTALRQAGIFVRDEEAMPVGDKAVGESWGKWVCPHIVGGIPLSVVEKEHPMSREGPQFTAIPGVCD